MLRQEVQDLHASLKVKMGIWKKTKKTPDVESSLNSSSHMSLLKYFNVYLFFHPIRRNAGFLESSKKSWTKYKDNWSK